MILAEKVVDLKWRLYGGLGEKAADCETEDYLCQSQPIRCMDHKTRAEAHSVPSDSSKSVFK